MLGGTYGCLARFRGMAVKPSAAKVIELDAAFDAAPIETPDGPIIWGTVTIEYTLGTLAPTVSIRVPVPWKDGENPDQRRAQALRSARQLIEHACRAAGLGPHEFEIGSDAIEDVIEAITPTGLEGMAQELGLAKPTTNPKPRKR